MRAFLAVLVAAILCTGAADASVTVRQTVANTSSNSATGSFTAALASAPTSGDWVIVVDLAPATGGAAPTIQDSNSNSLTDRVDGVTGSHSVHIFDEVAGSGLTGTITCTATVGGSCYDFAVIDAYGISSATYNSAFASSSAPTVTISTASGSLLACGFQLPSNTGSFSLSNAGTATTLVTGSSRALYALATSTSSVCSGTSSQTSWATAIASYNATAAVTTPAGCLPFSYPCVFRSARYEYPFGLFATA